MKIAYLTNQYPKISHTFIRREISALEQLGCTVARFSVRGAPEDLADEADRREVEQTRVLLDAPKSLMARAVAKMAAQRPAQFRHAVAAAARLSKPSERGLAIQFAYLAEACLLALWCEEEGIEHLHVHFGTNPTSVALLTHLLGGPKFSFTVHGPEEFDKAHLIHLGTKIEQASFVIAISDFGKSQLFRHCSASHWDKIKVIRCGVDQSFLARAVKPSTYSSTLVCVGRLCEQKGQLLLLEAARLVHQRGISFTLRLVGDGEMRSEVDARIRAYGLEDRVVVTGWASADQVISELEQARALVLPSFAEGLPVVIMESYALRRPVLSSYVAGIPELVEPGQSGWLVPAGSIERLADAMISVLEAGPATLDSMAEHGRLAVEANHDVMKNAATILEQIRAS